MSHPVRSWAVSVLCGLSVALVGAAPAAGTPELLADSTFVEQWTLANGLRVTTRHIPHAPAVAISLAYGTGSAADPVGQEGLGRLLAETEFTAAAGESPDRTRTEVDGQRPLGWQVKVMPRATQFLEVVTRPQYPVVLHQDLQRLRGVTVTPAVVRAAQASVRQDLAGCYRQNPDSIAWFVPRAAAAGADSAALERLASGAGLSGITARDVERMVHERFVPANAVLSLAGDLSGVDLHAFLDRECAAIPAGRTPDSAKVVLRAASLTLRVPGLSARAGMLGLIAPPIDDAVHPEFFLGMLVIGASAHESWGPSVPPLSTRFQFLLFDDPDLVRFYPPVDPAKGDTAGVAASGRGLFEGLSRSGVDEKMLDQLKRGVYWMFGGPMMPDLASHARREVAVSVNLSTTMAMRALWRPESFWEQYRRHFGAIVQLPMDSVVGYATDPRHQVVLAMLPAAAR